MFNSRQEAMRQLGRAGLLNDQGRPRADKLTRPVILLIPAAGRGSRLDYDGPKALYPIAGTPLLQLIHSKLSPLVNSLALVINPDHEQEFNAFFQKSGIGARLAFQAEPTGMGDAILLGAERLGDRLEEADLLIVWGDQVTVDPETVLICLLHHQVLQPESCITFPTCYMENPYIHFGRNAQGEISELRQRREGDPMPEIGENDTGVFITRGAFLAERLPEFKTAAERGTETREFNFLPFIPWASGQGFKVTALPIADRKETLGVNTREDAETIIMELGLE